MRLPCLAFISPLDCAARSTVARHPRIISKAHASRTTRHEKIDDFETVPTSIDWVPVSRALTGRPHWRRLRKLRAPRGGPGPRPHLPSVESRPALFADWDLTARSQRCTRSPSWRKNPDRSRRELRLTNGHPSCHRCCLSISRYRSNGRTRFVMRSRRSPS